MVYIKVYKEVKTRLAGSKNARKRLFCQRFSRRCGPSSVNGLPLKCQGSRPSSVSRAAPQMSVPEQGCQQGYPQNLWKTLARSGAYRPCSAAQASMARRIRRPPLKCQYRAGGAGPSSVNERGLIFRWLRIIPDLSPGHRPAIGRQGRRRTPPQARQGLVAQRRGHKAR